MAMHQYIGARYVPKFHDGSSGTDWTSNTQYEALTIVTRNGNSYTSKKPVPANIGAPESNPDYWASTGIYSAQVQQLQDDMTDAQADILALQNGTALKRRYVLIGDSYGLGVVGPGDPRVNGWCYYFKQLKGLSDDDAVESCADGAGFIGTGVSTFYDLLEATNGNVTDPDTITDVLVVGGRNDIDAGTSALRTAKTTFYNRAKTLYPNCRVSICFVGAFRGRSDNTTDKLQNTKSLYEENHLWRNLKQGATYVQSNANWAGNDNSHFNQDGYIAMGRWIADADDGGYPVVTDQYRTVSLTAESGYTLGQSGIQIRIAADTLYWNVPTTFSVTLPSPRPAAGTPFKIAELPDPYKGAYGNYLCGVPMMMSLHDTVNLKWIDAHGYAFIKDNGLYLVILTGNPAGSGFIDLTNIATLNLTAGLYPIPAWAVFG